MRSFGRPLLLLIVKKRPLSSIVVRSLREGTSSVPNGGASTVPVLARRPADLRDRLDRDGRHFVFRRVHKTIAMRTGKEVQEDARRLECCEKFACAYLIADARADRDLAITAAQTHSLSVYDAVFIGVGWGYLHDVLGLKQRRAGAACHRAGIELVQSPSGDEQQRAFVGDSLWRGRILNLLKSQSTASGENVGVQYACAWMIIRRTWPLQSSLIQSSIGNAGAGWPNATDFVPDVFGALKVE